MKTGIHSMPEACFEASSTAQFVQVDVKAQIRDHSNIAQAYAALGKAGEEVSHLVIKSRGTLLYRQSFCPH